MKGVCGLGPFTGEGVRMTVRRSIDVEMYTLAAAYLRSEQKLQEEIADILKVSQPEVSRLLKRAVKKKWLEYPPPVFRCPAEIRDLWERAHARFFSSERLLGGLRAIEPPRASRLQKVWIYHGGAGGHFDRTVLPAVEAVFAQAAVVGVTWGRTVHSLATALREHLPRPLRAENPVRFVPLCGELLREPDDRIEHTSSALAASLHELINGARAAGGVPPSLRGIPAFIPSGFNAAEVKTIRRFMRQFTGYGAVFGTADGNGAVPLAAQADTVLTSVGAVEAERRGIFLSERVRLGELSEAELTAAVVGDIGGLIIPRRKLTPAQARHIAAMNDRWTGIKQPDLERCAEAAAHEDRPGVVLLARDRHRKDMVLRCVELGLVNQLVISRELADELTGV
jgi:DNA-binding transcriptional regulator LsrR (DeoR family)